MKNDSRNRPRDQDISVGKEGNPKRNRVDGSQIELWTEEHDENQGKQKSDEDNRNYEIPRNDKDDKGIRPEYTRQPNDERERGGEPLADPIRSPREPAVAKREEEHDPKPCPEIGIRHAEVLKFQSLSPIPKPKADGDGVEGKVDIERKQTIQHGAEKIRQAGRVRKFHRGVDDATPRHADAQRNIQDHEQELTILVGIQLTDGRQFEHHPEEDAKGELEQIRRAVFEGVIQAEDELDIDDEFEEEEVREKHINSHFYRR